MSRSMLPPQVYDCESHPYGVRPPGNAYLADAALGNVRLQGLGVLNCLGDDLVVELLSFCSAESLMKLATTSKALYVFSHNPELWRELCLSRSSKNGINFVSTWKDTYTHMLTPDAPLHQPIVVDGIFSDLLYRSWACRACDIDRACPGFYNPCTVQRVASEDFSVSDFVERFELKNYPVIITGVASKWPAFTKWTWEYLEGASGGKTFRATSATATQSAFFSVSQYKRYAEHAKEEAPLYFFDRDFLAKSHLECDYSIPKYFDASSSTHGTDLFRLFGQTARPDYRWLIIGPKRSGSMFHIDPNQTNAWNAMIRGRKKWIFYPPGVTPPGVKTSPDGADVTMPLSTGEWLLSFWQFHRQALKHKDVSRRPLECILHPGELIFVPHNWWHMVINLDETVALTHNYVSSSNLVDCLYFLKHKVDQISGILERTMGRDAMVNNPKSIFNNFVDLLKESDPSLLDVALSKLGEKEILLKERSALSDVLGGSRKRKYGTFTQQGINLVVSQPSGPVVVDDGSANALTFSLTSPGQWPVAVGTPNEKCQNEVVAATENSFKFSFL